ncbi:MAG: nicotinate (nicotinamide) nucleotide adenylyltransferase [Chitinophagaceae bacterium]
MTVGLYFGSFNPVHIGHLAIASHIVNYTAMNQVWFVVSPQNPLKTSKSLLNEYHRLNLIQLAIEGESKLRASNIEFSLPRPSFTIDTLTYLNEKYPSYQFSIIMGSDSLQNIGKWKNFELILSNYPILVYKRPGFNIEEVQHANITVLEAPLFDISSTRVRDMIMQGNSIRYLVPDVVKDEIERNHYYK